MKEIMYSSITGNTLKLVDVIKDHIEYSYCGKIKEVTSDTVYVGFWTIKNTCPNDVKELLVNLHNKNIFLFGTCGYDFTEEYYNEILTNVKSNINSSNNIIGEFMCQGKVSSNKMQSLKETNPSYELMLPKLQESINHPNASDLNRLKELLSTI